MAVESTQDQAGLLREVFAGMDLDGSGMVEWKAVRLYGHARGMVRDDRMMTMLMSKAEADGQSALNWKEFRMVAPLLLDLNNPVPHPSVTPPTSQSPGHCPHGSPSHSSPSGMHSSPSEMPQALLPESWPPPPEHHSGAPSAPVTPPPGCVDSTPSAVHAPIASVGPPTLDILCSTNTQRSTGGGAHEPMAVESTQDQAGLLREVFAGMDLDGSGMVEWKAVRLYGHARGMVRDLSLIHI
eukprot:TRINITY_DN26708_c0_g1_i1.p1 TRINITY_DN26708_c0_g1~~TRINITY_DN26708_c0_g1_i1.p1  ORF type:complete len:240 (+),score=46.41 TRINITY_DN26708_c0_g1_i1:302-1021(+)